MDIIFSVFRFLFKAWCIFWFCIFALVLGFAAFIVLSYCIMNVVASGERHLGLSSMPETPAGLHALAPERETNFAHPSCAAAIKAVKYEMPENFDESFHYSDFESLSFSDKRILECLQSLKKREKIFPKSWDGHKLKLSTDASIWRYGMYPVKGIVVIYDKSDSAIYCVKFGGGL